MLTGWDTECKPFEPGLLAPPLACISYKTLGGSPQLVHWRDDDARGCAEWLLSQETTTAGGAFDLGVFGAMWPELLPNIFKALDEERVHCVFTRQKLIDIGTGCFGEVYKSFDGKLKKLNYSLADLALRHLGKVLPKDHDLRTSYGKWRELPLAQWSEPARLYPLDDADTTLAVHVEQARETAINLHDEGAQVQALWALNLISCWGICTDDDSVRSLLSKLQKEQIVRGRFLRDYGLVDSDGTRKVAPAKERMLRLMGENCTLTDTGYKKVKAGEMTKQEAIFKHRYICLDKDAAVASHDKVLRDYAEYASHQNLMTRVQGLITGPMPVQTRYDIVETTRTSSSKNKTIWNSSGTQNLPRKEGMRECFVARQDIIPCVLISCDYHLAELVSLAEVCYQWFGFSALRDTLNAGIDPHLLGGARLLGISYEEAVQRLKAHDKDVKEARQLFKVADFGYPGGLGADSFVGYAVGYGLDLVQKCGSVQAAKEFGQKLKREWEQLFPEMKLYFRRIRQIIESTGRRDPLTGKVPFGSIVEIASGRVRGNVRFTEACNNEFQGFTAQAAKAAMYEVCRRQYIAHAPAAAFPYLPANPLYGTRTVAFIHDELLVEAPLWYAHEAAMELQHVMQTVYQRFTPHVRVKADPALMLAWRKGAEPVYDASGRLIPWEWSAEGQMAANANAQVQQVAA